MSQVTFLQSGGHLGHHCLRGTHWPGALWALQPVCQVGPTEPLRRQTQSCLLALRLSAPVAPCLTGVCPASSCSPAPYVRCLEEPSVSPCRGPLPCLALWPKRTGHHFEILTNIDGTEQTFQSLLGTHSPPVPTTITGQLRGAGW